MRVTFLQKRSSNTGKYQYTYLSLILHPLLWNFISVKKKDHIMNVAGSSPKFLLRTIKNYKLNPISEREIGSCYVSTSIPPWWTDQMKIIFHATAMIHFDNIQSEGVCLMLHSPRSIETSQDTSQGPQLAP